MNSYVLFFHALDAILGHGPLSHGWKHVILLRMSSFPQVPSSSIIRSITCYNNQSSSKSPQTKQEKVYTVINRPWAKFTCDLWLGPIRKLKRVFNLDQTVCSGTWHCKVWVSLREKPSHPSFIQIILQSGLHIFRAVAKLSFTRIRYIFIWDYFISK